MLLESDENLTNVVTQTRSSTLSSREMSFWIERGSEGHSWEFGIDVYDNETWKVYVRPVQEVRTEATEKTARANEHFSAEREKAKRIGHRDQIIAVLTGQEEPLTKSKISEDAKLNSNNTKNALAFLLEQGQVIESPAEVNGRSYVAYQIPEQQTTTGLSVAPDNEDSQGNDKP